MVHKSVLATVVAMMLVLVIASAAFAYGPRSGAGTSTPAAGLCQYSTDLDGDGICDDWVDANGDGVNDTAPLDGTGSQHGGRGR